jgi:hypothetical protein
MLKKNKTAQYMFVLVPFDSGKLGCESKTQRKIAALSHRPLFELSLEHVVIAPGRIVGRN